MNKRVILDATGEEEPSRVYKVDLANKNINQILPVKQFDKLRCLVLSYNLIDRIENIQCFTDLRQLHLESNNIERIEGLNSNKYLQVLNLRSNRIEKIQNIGHLIKLQTLNLDSNQVLKISGLQYLKDLKNLYVSHNRIECLENLPAFSKLTILSLNNNRIKSISANLFSSSKTLSFLDLSHNRITSTTFLQPLTSLQILNLSHNKIKDLQVNSMPNLQSLDVSHNEIQKLPPIIPSFPQIISLNVSSNMICSEIQILSFLGQTEYLTEFDFRENPMFTQSFEDGLQKIHNFDFLNGKTMTKAGAKYYQKINRIQQDLQLKRQLYGEDDQQDRQIKMSGFYDDQLQFRMTGMKNNRPSSPHKKKKIIQKASFYDDIGRIYNQFSENDMKIKVIREQYLKICGEYNIKGSQHILTQLPAQTAEMVSKPISQEESKKEIKQEYSQQENGYRKENEKNLNKWKQLKQRQKSFNIRDVIKKSRGKDNSINRGFNSSTNSNWGTTTGIKSQKMKSQLLRTQAVPRKVGDDLLKTMIRPRSVRKKE